MEMKPFKLCYKLQKYDRDVETYLVSDLDISATDEKVDIVHMNNICFRA